MKKFIIALFFTTGFIFLKASAQSNNDSTKWQFSIADSASYKGKYMFEGLPFEYMEVTVQEGQLYFTGGEYKGFLIPMADKKESFDVNGQAIFSFTCNNENKIIELKVDYQGQTFQGKKEEKKT
jgi:hypothetical protein